MIYSWKTSHLLFSCFSQICPVGLAHLPYCLTHDGLPYALSAPHIVFGVLEASSEDEDENRMSLQCRWSPRLHPMLSFIVLPLLSRGDIVSSLDIVSRYFGFDFRNPGGPSGAVSRLAFFFFRQTCVLCCHCRRLTCCFHIQFILRRNA